MILVLREEIVCLAILAFLIFYYQINKVKDNSTVFLKLCSYGMLHLIFDIVTVITVNNQDIVPELLNRVCHIAFYFSGILFSVGLYNYVIDLLGIYKYRKVLKIVEYVPFAIFCISLAFLPMEYKMGDGTWYSFGPLAVMGYGLFLLYCGICLILLIVERKRLDERVRHALIPIIIVMYFAVFIQAVIPELLMTGAMVTVICIGLFVALDNPDKNFKEQALWDFLTGLKNRNCYSRDVERYENVYNNQRKGILVADLNYLKRINDNFGHIEGDRIITAAAHALKENLKTADNIYRVGGDEFVAIYIGAIEDQIEKEIEGVRRTCQEMTRKTLEASAELGYDMNNTVPLSLAMGFFVGEAGAKYEEVFEKADALMYENKAHLKSQERSV